MTFYVSTDIWYEKLRPVQFAVFMALNTGKIKDNTVTFPLDQIADMCQLSMNLLQKTLLELEKRNFIRIEKNQQNPKSNIIIVNKTNCWNRTTI
jgi:DNA-binding MarR family transcriptional regulator